MGREIEMLRTIGDSYMKRISEELRADSLRAGFNGTLNTGSWSNDSGIVTSYLSYYPSNDRSQDSVDAVITVMPVDQPANGVKFTADISRSDGEVIADIAECEIRFGNPDELLSEANKAYQAASEDIVTRLKALLLAG